MRRYVLGFYLAVALLPAIGLKATPTAYAGGHSIIVTTTDDELNTDGDCSLREAVESANTNTATDQCIAGVNTEPDYVVLTNGATYTLSLTGIDEDGNQTGDLDIVNDSAPSTDVGFTTNFGIATISGNDIDRVLHVLAGANVQIFNTTLTNGTADSGGIIYNEGSLLVSDSSVTNGATVNNGGGIYHIGSNLTIQSNSTISGNFSGDSGGGIFSNIDGATITLMDSDVSNNSSGSGGGINVDGAVTLNLTDTNVSGNIVSGEGGGILAAYGAIVNINTSSINNNQANEGDGGGILAHEYATFTMQNSTLLYNSANQRAGAIRPISGSSVAVATGNCIVGNTSGSEQDVFNDNTTFIPDFTGNWWGASDGPSGAGPGSGDSVSTNVNTSGFLTSTILGCPDNNSTPPPTFTPTNTPTNTATDIPTSTPTFAPPVDIVVTTTADELNTDGDCSLREAISAANLNIPVDQCPAGSYGATDTILLTNGATYILGLSGTDEDSNATGDFDLFDNGASPDIILTANSGTATIDGNDLDRILHIVSGEVTIEGLTLINGTSSSNGGIIKSNGSLTLDATYILNGFATDDGGGIDHDSAGSLTIQNGSMITGNVAGSMAGGIYVHEDGATVTITDSTVSYNSTNSFSGGGIAIFRNSTLTITNSAIIYNTATDGEGGGILAQNGPNITINNSAITNNTATGGEGGGGIMSRNHSGFNIQNSKILYNSSTNHGGAIYTSSFSGGTNVNYSCIVGNISSPTSDDVFDGTLDFVDYTNNWWGAPNGPGGGGSGSGDTVGPFVVHIPYLTAPILGCPDMNSTPTPTDTPVTPTDTPVTPTDTPITPTVTPITPTNTPVTPSSTPVTPTDTPITLTLTPTCAIVVVPPTLQSPVHRTHTTDTTPTFTWSQVNGAQSYRLMVYTEDRSFEFKKRRVGQTSTSYTLTNAEALVTAKYLWRVRTQDLGCGTWTKWSSRNTLFVD